MMPRFSPRRTYFAALAAFCCWALAPAASRALEPEGPTLVSAAASLTDAMKALVAARAAAQPRARIELNFGATGTLQSQIENGAPVHVFAGAAKRNIEQLNAKGLLEPGSIRVMCRNSLVLVAPRDRASDLPTTFSALAAPTIRRIAIGDPKSVPAGQYAVELLKLLGLHEQCSGKYILAENVRQALSWAEMGEVDAAIVYRTDALRSKKIRIVAEHDPNAPPRVEYAIALTRDGAKSAGARDFFEFVNGPEGTRILREAGFLVDAANDPAGGAQ